MESNQHQNYTTTGHVPEIFRGMGLAVASFDRANEPVSYTHLRAHET